jgi:type VI secretion system protein ImpE
MTETTLSTFLDTGDLASALAEASRRVQRSPIDAGARYLLAELLCFTGDGERADTHLGIVMTQDPASLLAVSLLRHLIRADAARRDWYRSGRPPELLTPMTDGFRLHLAAGVKARHGDDAGAAADLQGAEALRRPVSGSCDGARFDDFRDLDDSCGGFLELLTADGRYLWAGLDGIAALALHPPKRPAELLWRQAQLTLWDGSSGTVYLPGIYAGTEAVDDAERLGRSTDWVERNGASFGRGQRCFLVGDEAVGLLDIGRVQFDQPVAE